MTDRPSREERERASEKPGSRAPAPRSHPAPGEAVLDLQALAGNRAVADLLGGHEASLAAESHGVRVRDLLRSGRRPVQPAVQVQRILNPDTEKTWGEEKDAGSAEKTWGEEKGAGPAAASPMLAAGSSGPAVVRLQESLASAGFAVSADGVFGPRTRAAVIAFQVSQGLAADGIVGPGTRSALQGSAPVSAGAGPAGLAATGEMELAEPEWAMEKAGSGGSGTAEATLPQPDAWKKQGGEPEAKQPEAEPSDLKEST